MIRTLIEVSAEEEWQHGRQLETALGKLGFEPKESAESAQWRHDLFSALVEKGIEPSKLVADYRLAIEKKVSQ